MRKRLLVSAAAIAATLAMSAYAAETVHSGNISNMDQWYGRAGGLQGSDRVAALATGKTMVGVAYDADVAARTNMPREQATTDKTVGVTYDADVAARTNMPRGEASVTQQAAGDNGNSMNN